MEGEGDPSRHCSGGGPSAGNTCTGELDVDLLAQPQRRREHNMTLLSFQLRGMKTTVLTGRSDK